VTRSTKHENKKSGGGRRRRSTAEVRDRILDEATTLVLERGFEGASINELSARVGGSKTTLYAQFGNKEELFAAVVDNALRETIVEFDSIDYDHVEFEAGLIAIAGLFLRTVGSRQSIDVCRLAYFEARRTPEIGRLYLENGPIQGFHGLERFLQRHIDLGRLRSSSATKAADYFLGMLLHKFMLWRYCEATKPLTKRQAALRAAEVTHDFLKICDAF
jgi:AcrR family transcriptional regulator